MEKSQGIVITPVDQFGNILNAIIMFQDVHMQVTGGTVCRHSG
jgi:hypothetical protein